MAGSVTARGDGTWRLRVDADADPVLGRRRQITRTFHGTKPEANRALKALIAEVSAGRHGGTNEVEFGPLIDRWLISKQEQVAGSTLALYGYAASYVPETLRAKPARKITASDLTALYGGLQRNGRRRDGKGMSAEAVRDVHNVVRQSLEFGRRKGWLVFNVATDAEVPTIPRRLPTPAPIDQVDALLAAAEQIDPAFCVFERTSLAAGTRRGEMLGLRWSGVDYGRGRLKLVDTYVREGALGWAVQPRTKTGRGRIIDVDDVTLAALGWLHAERRAVAAACGLDLSPRAFVFSDEVDGALPWNPATTGRRHKRICAALGIDEDRLHDLRAAVATNLLDAGVSLVAVAGRLGHDRTSTTSDVYAGRVPQADRRSAEVLGDLLDGA
jgi:integrase